MEKTIKVEVFNITYDISEEDLDENRMTVEEIENELPTKLTFVFDAEDVEDEYDLEELIAEEISDQTGWLAEGFIYRIIK